MPITINGSTGISGVDGSAGTPALQGGDTNTGISFGTDVVIASTGGTERARIDANGNLLVGASSYRSVGDAFSPTSVIFNEGSGATDYQILAGVHNRASIEGPQIALGKSRGATNGSVTIVQSGDHLGEISFAGADGVDLETRAALIRAEVDGTPGTNDMPGRLIFSTTADGASSPTERIKINNSGTVTFSNYGTVPITLVTGTQSTNVTHDRILFNANTEAYYVVNESLVGVRLDNGTQSWAAQSDERLKTELNSFNDALAKVSTFRAGTGRFLTDDESVSRSFLIAQDVQEVLPEAVSVDNDEMGTLYLRYTELIPLLVAALKESKGRIETLETKVAALEAQP